ncbi:hypothetical protein P154DRAFT_527750 [Amniculicola lignicola CBS 123094]|uniref:Uncharacterized protein n=1 Tax=Amniculicola lignicola CBS 123094 TaxID=1392246 RepID=A0A6A5W739_9PLEO|nr:hypothetical protein P154DRAFT_527750 [Amniculicola lignicola CBS 123094]
MSTQAANLPDMRMASFPSGIPGDTHPTGFIDQPVDEEGTIENTATTDLPTFLPTADTNSNITPFLPLRHPNTLKIRE